MLPTSLDIGGENGYRTTRAIIIINTRKCEMSYCGFVVTNNAALFRQITDQSIIIYRLTRSIRNLFKICDHQLNDLAKIIVIFLERVKFNFELSLFFKLSFIIIIFWWVERNCSREIKSIIIWRENINYMFFFFSKLTQENIKI